MKYVDSYHRLYIIYLALLTLAGPCVGLAQANRLIALDLKTGVRDTLALVDFNKTIARETTHHCLGNYSDTYTTLYDFVPTENLMVRTQFTVKVQAATIWNIDEFPARSNVILYNEFGGFCSGSLISRRHVISAAHCLFYDDFNPSMYIDSLIVCPSFDKGKAHPAFGCSKVVKAYYFEKWDYTDSDVIVFELEDPLGEQTGWLGIGFDAQDDSLTTGLFYKFSYPGISLPPNPDSNVVYRPTSMHFNYGLVDLPEPDILGIKNAYGAMGESGSALIKIKNGSQYTNYGVCCCSANFSHTRITNWKYYAIKQVIEKEITNVSDTRVSESHRVVPYPNPVFDKLRFLNTSDMGSLKITLLDASGRQISFIPDYDESVGINVSSLPSGLYFCIIEGNGTAFAHKVLIKPSVSSHAP